MGPTGMRFVVSVVLALLLVAWLPVSAAGQETASDPLSLADLEGVEGAAARDYRSLELSPEGPQLLTFTVVAFADEAAAEAGFERIVEAIAQTAATETPDVRRASAPDVGDEAAAYVGRVGEDAPRQVAFLMFRDGRFVQALAAIGFAGDLLPALSDVAARIEGRQPGGDETPVGDNGMRTGGLWDMLPAPDDLPEGFELAEERIPEPFARPTSDAAETTAPPPGDPSAPASLLVGNAAVRDRGEPGVLAVVALGPYNGATMPVVLRNNTGEGVSHVRGAVAARSADGDLLATANDVAFLPAEVPAGGLAIGFAYFDLLDLPYDAVFEVEPSADPPGNEAVKDLEIVDVSPREGWVVGKVRNPHEVALAEPLIVTMICFDDGGNPLYARDAAVDADELPPSETAPFAVELPSGESCERFLIAASGYAAP